MSDDSNETKLKAFFHQVKVGNIDNIKKLLEENLEVNYASEKFGLSFGFKNDAFPLAIASYEGLVDVVKLLLNNGADVNQRNNVGESALFIASRQGNADVVQTLLKNEAKVSFKLKALNSSSNTGLYENWEVYTQVLKNAYPRSINCEENSKYKKVAQILIDYTFNNDLTNKLYETLFCSLTILGNPLALYAISSYATLCPDLAMTLFSDENFLRALCRAYKPEKPLDFLNAVDNLLHINKLKQKEIARTLLTFSWSRLVKRFATEFIRTRKDSTDKTIQECVYTLLHVLQIFATHFDIRIDFQSKLFRELETEDIGKIGRMLKIVIDMDVIQEGFNLSLKDVLNCAWQFLFFFVKSLLRLKKTAWISKLLLRDKRVTENNNNNIHHQTNGNEFEHKILIRSFEETPDLAHMLLDYGVVPNGACFAMAIQLGHVDIVNRLKEDHQLLFCKEVTEVMASNRTSRNRNKRLCLKAVKSARNKIENARKSSELELLGIVKEVQQEKVEKVKSKRRKKKRSVSESQVEQKKIEIMKENGSFEQGDKQKKVRNNSVSLTGDISSGDALSDSEKGNLPRKNNSRKKKKKVKPQQNFNKDQNDNITNEEPIPVPQVKFQHNQEWDFVPRRRRRQSSSSSDFSTCSHGKNVHFSNPLVEYDTENKSKATQNNRQSAPCILKHFEGNTKIRTSNDALCDIEETNNMQDNLEDVNHLQEDCSQIQWKPSSKRWNARYEYLSEMDPNNLKQLHLPNSDDFIYFNDVEKHLLIGSGPDFSAVHIGLMKNGCEVAIKKINTKRVPILLNEGVIEKLTLFDSNCRIQAYNAIIREKNHFYLIQSVTEYSLEQMFHMKKQHIPHFYFEHNTIDICNNVVCALKVLHEKNIMHMALKPSNVMFDANGNISLSDYGVHTRNYQKSKKMNMVNAMHCWLPFEVHDHQNLDEEFKYTPAIDLASLGMLLYYTITEGGHPFGDPDSTPTSCIGNILRGSFNLKAISDPFAHHLIRNLIQKEPQKRFTLDQVINHPLFWDSAKRNEYLKLVSEILVLEENNQTNEVYQKLFDTVNRLDYDIFNSYSNSNTLKADVRTAIQLLQFIRKSYQDKQIYATSVENSEEYDSPLEYFWTNFPGIILHLYNHFTMQELKTCLYNLREENISDIGLKSEHSEKQMNDEIFSAVMEKVDVEIEEEENEDDNPIFVNEDGTENGICLLEDATSPHDDGETSPDDWIDIGSPLETSATSLSIQCEARKCLSPPTSNSASSVDDCFDFGHFEKAVSKMKKLTFTDINELD